MPTLEPLAGLPASGPPATPFSLDGRGHHREGMVVRIVPDTGAPWIANVARGAGTIDALLVHPDGIHVIAIHGAAYIIEPAARRLVTTIDPVRGLAQAPGIVVLADLGHLHVLTAAETWRTARLSLDDFADLRIADGRVLGATVTGDDDAPWSPFAIELATRVVSRP